MSNLDNDYIKVDYLIEAFPDGEVDVSIGSVGDSPDKSRLAISVWNNDLRYTHSFQRQLLVDAMNKPDIQEFVIGVFKARLK